MPTTRPKTGSPVLGLGAGGKRMNGTILNFEKRYKGPRDGAGLFLCPYPPKVKARPLRNQRPATRSRVS